jgi:hypothetical protein
VRASSCSRHVLRLACATAILIGATAPEASSQIRPRVQRPPRPSPHAGSWELGGGVLWTGGIDLGRRTAEETSGRATGPFALFDTDTEIGAPIGVHARLAGYLSRWAALEVGVRYSRPTYSIRATSDAESAPDVEAKETIDAFQFDGSVVLHLTKLSFSGGRGVPFMAAGAGHIREVHEGGEFLETGIEYHAAGGFKLWFSNRARRLGTRAEGGVSLREGGSDFSSGRKAVPFAAASLVYLF